MILFLLRRCIDSKSFESSVLNSSLLLCYDMRIKIWRPIQKMQNDLRLVLKIFNENFLIRIHKRDVLTFFRITYRLLKVKLKNFTDSLAVAPT